MRPKLDEATVRWGGGTYTLRLRHPTQQQQAAARLRGDQQLRVLMQLIATNLGFARDVGGLLQLAYPMMRGSTLALDLWRRPLRMLLASGRARLTFTLARPYIRPPCPPSNAVDRGSFSPAELPSLPSTKHRADATTTLRLFYSVEAKLYEGDVALVPEGGKCPTVSELARPHDGFIEERRCRALSITHWHLHDLVAAAKQDCLADFVVHAT